MIKLAVLAIMGLAGLQGWNGALNLQPANLDTNNPGLSVQSPSAQGISLQGSFGQTTTPNQLQNASVNLQ